MPHNYSGQEFAVLLIRGLLIIKPSDCCAAYLYLGLLGEGMSGSTITRVYRPREAAGMALMRMVGSLARAARLTSTPSETSSSPKKTWGGGGAGLGACEMLHVHALC
jgi:hypothetical protein